MHIEKHQSAETFDSILLFVLLFIIWSGLLHPPREVQKMKEVTTINCSQAKEEEENWMPTTVQKPKDKKKKKNPNAGLKN